MHLEIYSVQLQNLPAEFFSFSLWQCINLAVHLNSLIGSCISQKMATKSWWNRLQNEELEKWRHNIVIALQFRYNNLATLLLIFFFSKVLIYLWRKTVQLRRKNTTKTNSITIKCQKVAMIIESKPQSYSNNNVFSNDILWALTTWSHQLMRNLTLMTQ